MPFIEAPTTFYVGRRYDPAAHRMTDEVIYYDSRDLTTHAVVVGMTGSGKTGLCITLLEEAALDNIPSIVIDPKGDITNLLLAFPDMRPDDFEPWVNLDDARRAGQEPHEFAQAVAARWRQGLGQWDITPERVQQFKQNARFSIYTPGSDAGLPISILDAMQAPRGGWQPGDDEYHRERINGIVTALLALIGKSVEPVKDREHVLIANLFEAAWRQGQSLTLEDVILGVQNPPFTRLGVFDVNTFFPEKERFALAMELNNLIAAPSFGSWVQGEPLDVQSLLYTPEGKPRVSIFYIAHLNDAERMFIVTLLLENVLAWTRSLSGTTSLRALLYIDEMYGYFPPYPYNPPSKDPLLRLLKQARAFGLGLVLATQNPGDLDYKGLSNAGTWFIGKLQTDRDKQRVLNGLESVEGAEGALDLREVDRLLSSIDPRVFVMHNVHDDSGAIPIHTRWAMSYLRGPLTRQQIRLLMEPQRAKPTYPTRQTLEAAAVAAAPARPAVLPPGAVPPPPATLPEMPTEEPTAPATLPDWDFATAPVRPQRAEAPPPALEATVEVGATLRQPTSSVPPGFSLAPPPLPSTVAQYFLPVRLNTPDAVAQWERRMGVAARETGRALLAYQPLLIAQAEVRYADRKSNVALVHAYSYQIAEVPPAGLIPWDEWRAPYVDPKLLTREPQEPQVAYGQLGAGLADAKRLKELEREITDFIYKTKAVVLLHNPALDLYSQPDMTHRDFLIQAHTLARQRRDEEIDQTVSKYEKQFDRLEAKLRKTARALDAEQQQLQAAQNEEMFTTGEALLSLLRGRTTYTLSRISRVRRYKGYVQEDVHEHRTVIGELEDQLAGLEQEMQQALAEINARWGEAAGRSEEYRITPYKKDIYLSVFGVGWKPAWILTLNGQPTVVPAWEVG